MEGDCTGSGGTDWYGDWVGAALWAGGGSGSEVKAVGTAVFDGPDVDAGAGRAGAFDSGGQDAGATGVGVCAVEPAGGDGAD